MKAGFVIMTLLLCLCGTAFGQAVRQQDPADTRVFAIAARLRCPVCQSETILDSQSSSAKEMLRMVREMVTAGRGDAEILTFFHDRYGDYVLMEPPARGANHLLWFLPLLVLALGVIALAVWLRRLHGRDTDAGPDAAAADFTESDLERMRL